MDFPVFLTDEEYQLFKKELRISGGRQSQSALDTWPNHELWSGRGWEVWYRRREKGWTREWFCEEEGASIYTPYYPLITVDVAAIRSRRLDGPSEDNDR